MKSKFTSRKSSTSSTSRKKSMKKSKKKERKRGTRKIPTTMRELSRWKSKSKTPSRISKISTTLILKMSRRSRPKTPTSWTPSSKLSERNWISSTKPIRPDSENSRKVSNSSSRYSFNILHNRDTLPRPSKTILIFYWLLISNFSCGVGRKQFTSFFTFPLISNSYLKKKKNNN